MTQTDLLDKLLAEAQEHLNAKEFHRAAEFALDALEVDPQSKRARNLLVEAKKHGGDHARAIKQAPIAVRSGWHPDTQQLDDEQEQAWDKDQREDDTPK